jgi:hypothetical protein
VTHLSREQKTRASPKALPTLEPRSSRWRVGSRVYRQEVSVVLWKARKKYFKKETVVRCIECS